MMQTTAATAGAVAATDSATNPCCGAEGTWAAETRVAAVAVVLTVVEAVAEVVEVVGIPK